MYIDANNNNNDGSKLENKYNVQINESNSVIAIV